MFDLLQALELFSFTTTTLLAGTGVMLGTFAGILLPVGVSFHSPQR